jgi:hypothetical protein
MVFVWCSELDDFVLFICATILLGSDLPLLHVFGLEKPFA